jgi:hypothetical protein
MCHVSMSYEFPDRKTGDPAMINPNFVLNIGGNASRDAKYRRKTTHSLCPVIEY